MNSLEIENKQFIYYSQYLNAFYYTNFIRNRHQRRRPCTNKDCSMVDFIWIVILIFSCSEGEWVVDLFMGAKARGGVKLWHAVLASGAWLV